MSAIASSAACARLCAATSIFCLRASISSCIRAAPSSPWNSRNLSAKLCVSFNKPRPRRHALRNTPRPQPRSSPHHEAPLACTARLLQTLAFARAPYAASGRLQISPYLFGLRSRGHRYTWTASRLWPGRLETSALPSLYARRIRSRPAGRDTTGRAHSNSRPNSPFGPSRRNRSPLQTVT